MQPAQSAPPDPRTIEIATYADRHFDGVATLWKEAFPSDRAWNAAEVAIPEKLRIQPDLLMVALHDDAVIGSVMAGYDGHRGWISRIAVLDAWRGRDIGAKLIAEAERRLAALGCFKVNLQVVATNAGVVEFYQSCGYAVEQRISMSKHLSKSPA